MIGGLSSVNDLIKDPDLVSEKREAEAEAGQSIHFPPRGTQGDVTLVLET